MQTEEHFAATYDAWGNRTITNNTLAFDFDHGYTGHEHLDEFGLINMNGRVYDPVLGRFLSPDPFVQMPDNSQNFNRYSYCLNNPLKYTDPSGEFIFSVLSAIFCPPLMPLAVGLDMGWMSGGFQAAASGGSFWNGAAVGLATSAVSVGVSAGMGSILGAGTGFIHGFAMAATPAFAGAFVSGVGNGLLNGESFGDALWSGTKGGLMAWNILTNMQKSFLIIILVKILKVSISYMQITRCQKDIPVMEI